MTLTNLDADINNQGNITTHRLSGASFNASSDLRPFRERPTPQRADYGRLAVAWWQEILSFLLAAAAFVATAIIWAKYNGQE